MCMAGNMIELVRHVLAEYPAECQALEIQPLGNAGGFSGALIWRCQTRLGPLCLRRWPPGQTLGRLAEVHALMRHVAEQRFALVPIPLATRDGSCAVLRDGALWDLTTWLSGRAIEGLPGEPLQIRAAMAALARLHLAAASFLLWPAHTASAPVVHDRLATIAACTPHQQEKWRESVSHHPWPELEPRARELLDLVPRRLPDAARQLESFRHVAVPLQACLRDVWRANVLWEDGRVTGIVDWAAARCDSPAADIARLLGSLAANDIELWHAGLAAYQAVRPLDNDTLALTAALDAVNVALMPLNWLRMLLDEGREFDDRRHVLQRLDECLARLRCPAPLVNAADSQ